MYNKEGKEGGFIRAKSKKTLIVYFILIFIVIIEFNGCKLKTTKPPVPNNKVIENNITKPSENKKTELDSNNINPNNISRNNVNKKVVDKSNKLDDFEGNSSQSSSKKEVYLTFDDGPTKNTTRQILDILKQSNVKATFFVIGTMAEKNPKLLKELSDNDMCVVPHTYSHRYNEIFSSPESYIEDLDKCTDLIESITKKEVVSYIRIPGGMENRYVSRDTMLKITNNLREKNISYVGWNICPNDAVGKRISAEEIKNNVINQSKILKNNKALVILLHDSYYKRSTVEALPYIISYYKKQGYEFKTFDNITKNTYDELKKQNVINKNVNKAKIK